MTDAMQRAAARQFAADWKGKGYEKGESQPFQLALLRNVYSVERAEQFIVFEEQVHLDHEKEKMRTKHEREAEL